MTKWADYLISHVTKNSSGVIINVILHVDYGDTISSGSMKTEAEVIALLKQGYKVNTVIWGYPKWINGASVGYVKGIGGEFLRTDQDKTAKDNLDNMIPTYS